MKVTFGITFYMGLPTCLCVREQYQMYIHVHININYGEKRLATFTTFKRLETSLNKC